MTPQRVRLEFQRGGVLVADVLADVAPQTAAAVLSALPLDTTAYHTRWCGREVYFPLTLGGSAPAGERHVLREHRRRDLLAGVGED
jgi:hypothetical protein